MPREQFAYLMLRVGPWGRPRKSNGPVEAGMRIASPALSVKAWTSSVELTSNDSSANSRMFFALKNRASNDTVANRIAESVILVFELMQGGPLLLGSDIELVVRLPFTACPPKRTVLIAQDLADAALIEGTSQEWPEALPSEIFNCSFVDPRLFGLGWGLAPTVLEIQWLHDALAFYSASVRRFYVWDVDIPEADRKLGENRSELAIAEGSFQDAYKAIEAVVGDPGNCGDRFLSAVS
jgi:hypothetical protein